MGEEAEQAEHELSPWWRRAVLITVAVGFAILIAVSVGAYRTGPPIPQKVIGPDGEPLFTGDDVLAGQQVFLKHALMQNGSVWGHGAYLGPDFSAAYLHQVAVRAHAMLALRLFGRPREDLSEPQRAALNAEVHQLL